MFRKWLIAYEKDIGRFSSEEISCYLTELNISRGWMAAVALLLFQAANLFDPAFYKNIGMIAGFSVLVPGCILFLIYFYLYRKKNVRASWRAEWIYLSFWGIVSLGMMPYFAHDVTAGGMPSNCILLCCALMIVPVFPTTETIVLFTVYTVANLVISIGLNASLVYNLYIVSICGMGCLFSCRTHQFYIGVIEELRDCSRRDYLTQMFNRRGGREQVYSLFEMCLRHGKIFAFFMIDIDGFKYYNDKFGHRKGDEALIAAADCLKGCFERKSDILCRFGGEEFLVAASIRSAEEAARIAELMRRRVEERELEGAFPQVSPYLTISIGVSVYIPDGTGKQEITVDGMIQEADKALYRAKEEGRNRVYLTEIRGSAETSSERPMTASSPDRETGMKAETGDEERNVVRDEAQNEARDEDPDKARNEERDNPQDEARDSKTAS